MYAEAHADPYLPAVQRRLTGRFLHITDIHPDPYYKPGTSVKKDCHRKKPRKKKNRSGYYGTAYSCVGALTARDAVG